MSRQTRLTAFAHMAAVLLGEPLVEAVEAPESMEKFAARRMKDGVWNLLHEEDDGTFEDTPAMPPPGMNPRGDADDPEEDSPEEPETPWTQAGFTFVPVQSRLPAPTDDEETLHQRWKTTRDPRALEGLFAHNMEFLRNKAQTGSRFRLPPLGVQGAVNRAFLETIERWDPQKGNLRTFYNNSQGPNLYKKLRQLGQFGQAPREHAGRIQRIRQVQQQLELEQEKPPTLAELGAELRGEFKLKDIKAALASDRRDLLGSRQLAPDAEADPERTTYRAIRRARDLYALPHQRLMNAMFGIDGAALVESNKQLAAQFGLSPQHVSNLRARFLGDIQRELQRMGG